MPLRVSTHALTRWMGRGPVTHDRALAEASLRAHVVSAKPISGKRISKAGIRGQRQDRTFRSDGEYIYVMNAAADCVLTVLEVRSR
jgi:hypothetical protein